jgi:hypothetical protein
MHLTMIAALRRMRMGMARIVLPLKFGIGFGISIVAGGVGHLQFYSPFISIAVKILLVSFLLKSFPLLYLLLTLRCRQPLPLLCCCHS